MPLDQHTADRRAIQAQTTKDRAKAGLPKLSHSEAVRLAEEEYQRQQAAGKPKRKRAQPSATAAAPSSSSTPASSPAPAPAQPAGTQPAAANPNIGAAMTAAAQPVADPDPAIADALSATMQLVQPTWKVEGKFLVIWSPMSRANGGKDVRLPIKPKPGPLTPVEDVHDVLGMPEMLYTVALAIAVGKASLITGPTGVAKSTIYRWLAKKLNWNFIPMPMHPKIAPEDLVGEFKPFMMKKKDGSEEMILRWMWGMVAKCVLASKEWPTIGTFEEINRGDIRSLVRIYSLLDDTRELVIDEKGEESGIFGERMKPGELYFGANMNPVDFESDLEAGVADYIGATELDPALNRRFPAQITVGYPPKEIEAEALRRRVPGLTLDQAKKMVTCATAVRDDPANRFPMSFPDMVMWAEALPYYGWEQAAEIGVVQKANPRFRESIRRLLEMKPTGAAMS